MAFRLILFIATFLFHFASPSLADDYKIAGQAGAFLRVPTGTRAIGLGGAYVSVADDPNAIYWNPAGLSQMNNSSVELGYSRMSLDRQHSFVAAALSLGGLGTLGFMWNRFSVSDIDGRDSAGYPTEDFGDAENALIGGLSQSFGQLSLGASVKYLQHSLANNKATGYAFDAGVLLNVSLPDEVSSLRLGLTASDMGGSLTWDTRSKLNEMIPVVYRSGASIETTVLGAETLLCISYISTKNETPYMSFGMEVSPFSSLSLRSGYSNESLHLGVSISVNTIGLDLAYSEDVLNRGGTMTIGLRLTY